MPEFEGKTVELTPRMVEAIGRIRKIKGDDWTERDVLAVALWRWVEELEKDDEKRGAL